MKLAQYFFEGKPTYMAIITVCGLLMLYFSFRKVYRMVFKKEFDLLQLNYILLFGSLSFIIGILFQAYGFFIALGAIADAGDIAMSLMARGLKLSMIAPVYGLIILLLSIISWGVLKEINLRRIGKST